MRNVPRSLFENGAAYTLVILLFSTAGEANEDGAISGNCSGCHYGDGRIRAPNIDFESNVLTVPSGETSTIPVSLSAANANAFGVLIQGADGQSTSEPSFIENDLGLGHSEPLVATSGSYDFDFLFTAPLTPGVSRIDFQVIAANRNSDPADDTFGGATLDIVYGCEPIITYQDDDGDGFGNESRRFVSCTESYGVSIAGDCDDSDSGINPSAKELCNLVDDNCDGQLDEGLQPGFYYQDLDGDGFGAPGDEEFTCLGPGLADNNDDCDDSRAGAFPDAPEICNQRDDNCNGSIDEACVAVGTCDTSGDEPCADIESCDSSTGEPCPDKSPGCSTHLHRPDGRTQWAGLLLPFLMMISRRASRTRRRQLRASSN